MKKNKVKVSWQRYEPEVNKAIETMLDYGYVFHCEVTLSVGKDKRVFTVERKKGVSK